jgi:hypothetical protein
MSYLIKQSLIINANTYLCMKKTIVMCIYLIIIDLPDINTEHIGLDKVKWSNPILMSKGQVTDESCTRTYVFNTFSNIHEHIPHGQAMSGQDSSLGLTAPPGSTRRISSMSVPEVGVCPCVWRSPFALTADSNQIRDHMILSLLQLNSIPNLKQTVALKIWAYLF